MSDAPLRVTREQALAFRVARHHLHERLGPDGARDAAAVGLQDTPPGTASLSLAARADVAPEALEELVLVPSVRGAPLAVARQDLAVFTTGLEPPDEAAAGAVFGLPPKGRAVEDPGAELARRFLRAYGPARPGLFADWAGLATTHARGLWERAGELVEVAVDGTKSWALAGDEPALAEGPKIGGVRLLANLDPLNAGRDRELLVPDAVVRKRIWRVLGGPGTVLVRGEVGGLWRSSRKARRLLVTVEPLGKLTATAKDALAAEAERIAPFRGAGSAELTIATI